MDLLTAASTLFLGEYIEKAADWAANVARINGENFIFIPISLYVQVGNETFKNKLLM